MSREEAMQKALDVLLKTRASREGYCIQDDAIAALRAALQPVQPVAPFALPIRGETIPYEGEFLIDAKGRMLHGAEIAEYINRTAAPPGYVMVPETGYYLACFKDGRSRGIVTWWRPNNAGYTPYLEQAGIYQELRQGYHDSEDTVPVPVAFVRKFTSTVLDVGLEGHECWWTAEKLRAALSAAKKGGE